MARLTQPQPGDVFVNACCGSGTLLAERLRQGALGAAFGFDISRAALDCAGQNLRFMPAARVVLAIADAGALPLPAGSASSLVADPPFAMLMGEGESNRTLYPSLFREAARVLKPGGIFAIISTQERLVREMLASDAHAWSVLETIRLKLPFERGYITPTLRALRRR
jgi:23S rRNA G2445 N2-methylase RlmL